jgi:amidase
LPVGSHFLARPGEEALLFALAEQLEAARPWADRWPPVSVSRL